MVLESEVDKAHLTFKMPSLTGASVIYHDCLLVLTLRLLSVSCFCGTFCDPLEKILKCIVFCDYLRVDPCIRDLGEKFGGYCIGSDISELPSCQIRDNRMY